jgi:hypothetical protein
MKLIVTHHAFLRMGDWHPQYRDLVPTGKITLNREQASAMMIVLHALVAGLDRSFASTRVERLEKAKTERYGRESYCFFDRTENDLYHMSKQDMTATLLTVTWIESKEDRRKILNVIRPAFRFQDVTEIALPYHRNLEAAAVGFAEVRKPSGGILPVTYGCYPKIKEELQVEKPGGNPV